MDRILKFKEIGFECDFEACGHTDEEVFKKAGEHARTVHGVDEAAFVEKARAAIYEGYCDYGDSEEMISEDFSECYDECYACADECCC